MFIHLRTTSINQFYSASRQLIALLMIFSLSACVSWLPNAHRLDLQQGNSIGLSQVKKLKPGMHKAEVRRILGSPILADPFHNQRWDYIYRFVPEHGIEKESHLTLFFKNDTLKKIDDKNYVDESQVEPESASRSVD